MATTASLPPYMLPGVSVHQPTHLEGDPTLATEILPGPPSLVSAQQSAQKRDPRKPSTAYSYLPLSDPGSTYSGIMHGTLIGHEEPRSKRSRSDKGATGRAQRASARNQSASTLAFDPTSSTEAASGSGVQPIVLEAEPSGSATGDEDATLSRSNSSLNLQEATHQVSVSKAGKKDKGKGKEVETTSARVKEDLKGGVTPESSTHLLKNNDHCSSCEWNGALVYCDGCPRAFHLWCLDPPMENIDESDSSRWFCPSCQMAKNPPRKPPASFLSPLIYQVQTSIPVEFQLPDDIRNFFRDVTTGPKGVYVDAAEVKPPRLNRHGQLEDRDPHRLRDKNGAAVLCFRCGMSALPTGLASTVPTAKRPRRGTYKASTPDGWKGIVSCDYCDLHWHLDCLSPPMPTMPPFNKKWMCPNHSERVLPPKRRIPKNHAMPIEITKHRQYNNGNIEIVQSEPPPAVVKPRVQVDEVLINGRRYRVPEKIVILDFWSKLNRHEPEDDRDLDMVSALSSPLTSLSSLDDPNEFPQVDSPQDSLGDVQAAELLFNFSSASRHPPAISKTQSFEKPVQPTYGVSNGAVASPPSSSAVVRKTPTSKVSIPAASQTAPVTAPTSTRPSRSAKNAASLRISNAMTNFHAESMSLSRGESVVEEAPKKRQRAFRKHPEKKVVQTNSTRELRSRSRNTTQESVSSVAPEAKTVPGIRVVEDGTHAEGSMSASATGPRKFRAVFVKHEEEEAALTFSLPASDQASSSAALHQTSPRKRPSRRSAIKAAAAEETAKLDDKDTKEKRGRKRKIRDDDLPEPKKTPATTSGKRSRKDKVDAGDDSGAKGKKKSLGSPSKATPSAAIVADSTPDSISSRLVPPTPIPATPTKLKIRLPRIGSAVKPATIANGNADTPTHL